MKGQLKAATPAEYIAQLEEPRKADIAALDAMIRKLAPKLAPFIHIGILAYGPRRYKYESGREGDWFHIGVASNQSYISLYVAAAGSPTAIANRSPRPRSAKAACASNASAIWIRPRLRN